MSSSAAVPASADASARYLRPHYAPGVPGVIARVTEPLSCMLDDAARRFPDRVALDFLGRPTTYRRLSEQVDHAAEALRRLGVGRGDVVGVILPNCPQHVVIAYAAWRIGAIIAEHNPLAPAAQIREQIELHRGRVIIAWEKSLARLVQAAGSLDGAGMGDLRVLAVDLSRGLPWTSRLALRLPVAAARSQRSDLRGRVPAGVASWDDLAATTTPLPAGHPLPEVDEVAVLLYTGGTTGTPKAVALTHANARSNAEMSLVWASQTCEVGQETFYAVLPFFHAFGLSLSLPGVPVMFDRIVTRALATGVDLSSCKIAVCGAAANPRTVAESWEKATGGVIIEGYGMTETSPIVLGNPISPERRAGALGVPYPSTDVRVIDPDDPDRDVAPGQIGELIVRGPQVFTGYWENPEETEAVMLPGGWLRTGDLVRQEEDGFYVIADRRKELIISGGFNIYPTEVEAAVRSMPQVEDVAVVGLPAESGNESVVAAILPRQGQTVTLEQVRQWAEKTLSHYALPRQVSIVSELPRSQIGKVLRRVVREELLAAREAATAAGAAVSASASAATSCVGRLGEAGPHAQTRPAGGSALVPGASRPRRDREDCE